MASRKLLIPIHRHQTSAFTGRFQIEPNNKKIMPSSMSSRLAQAPARSVHPATRLAGVTARLMAINHTAGSSDRTADGSSHTADCSDRTVGSSSHAADPFNHTADSISRAAGGFDRMAGRPSRTNKSFNRTDKSSSRAGNSSSRTFFRQNQAKTSKNYTFSLTRPVATLSHRMGEGRGEGDFLPTLMTTALILTFSPGMKETPLCIPVFLADRPANPAAGITKGAGNVKALSWGRGLGEGGQPGTKQ
jgi:hypothetical protein